MTIPSLAPLSPALRAGLLAISVLTGAAAAQDPAARRERQVDSLFAEYTMGLSPGAAVAVVRDGQVLLSRGYGYASLEHRTPITPATVFDVASVSKQFAGLAVAMLADQGRIQLSDDIRQYLPQLADVGKTITIDHLVHHTSGLRDWPGTLRLAGWQYDDVISFSQILTFAANQRTLNFAPGSEYMYSNTGFNLLAEMVGQVTGTSFRAWTTEQLFRPLGMTNSHFHDDHREVVPNRANGYGRTPNGMAAITNNLTALGSSSLFTTVEDMARWVMNFDDPKVGGPKAMALSRTKGVLTNGTTIPYAFGISHGEYRGLPTLSHGGSWAGFTTAVLHFPGQRFSVVVLANSPIVPATRFANFIADFYLGAEMARHPTATPAAGTRAATTDPVASAPPVAATPEALDRYPGVYRFGPGLYLRIARNGDRLTAETMPGPDSPMTPKSDTSFWLPGYNSAVVFHPTGSTVTAEFRGLRSAKYPVAAPQLPQFAGDYWSDELATLYQVEVKDDKLVLRHRRHPPNPLTWLAGDDFAGVPGSMRSVEFLRDSAGQVTGFSVFIDERSRDVRFSKQPSRNPK